MTKTGMALQWCCEALCEGKPTFWTWTYERYMDWPEAALCWSGFIKHLTRRWQRPGRPMPGVRAFEPAPVTERPHVHGIIDGRVPVALMLSIGPEHGIGRVSVSDCWNSDAGKYIAKYCQKAQRGWKLSGRRLWGRFGNWDRVRLGPALVKNVKMEGPFQEAYRATSSGSSRFLRAMILLNERRADQSFSSRCITRLAPGQSFDLCQKY